MVFDRLAEVVVEHLAKGGLVSVTGRLRSSEWTTPDGQRRFRLDAVGENVKFLDRKKAEAAT